MKKILKYMIPVILASTLTASTAFADTETECRQMIYEMEEYIEDEEIRNVVTSIEMTGLGYHDGTLYDGKMCCGVLPRAKVLDNKALVVNGASLTGFVGRVTARLRGDAAYILYNPERTNETAALKGISTTYEAYRDIKERSVGLSDREKFDMVMEKVIGLIPKGSSTVCCTGNAVLKGEGSCGAQATLMCILCGAAGIPVDIVECCTQPIYAPGKAHGYNKVTLDGKDYYTDVGYYEMQGGDYYLSKTKFHYDLEEAKRNAEKAGQNKH